MFRLFGTIVSLLILAVILPKVAAFLTAYGWPVQDGIDLARQGLTWFGSVLRQLFG